MVEVLVFGQDINIKIFIEKFNFVISFGFPYNLKEEGILQHILNGVQLKIYEEVFKKGE